MPVFHNHTGGQRPEFVRVWASINPATAVWLALVLLACTGCGGSDKPLVPVAGQATYGGGAWPIPGTITFTPVETSGSLPARPGSARFLVDGNFVVGSYQPGDGLMPGKYHVTISCIDPIDFSKPREELEFVPADYRTEDLVVEAGQDPITLTYDVPKKK